MRLMLLAVVLAVGTAGAVYRHGAAAPDPTCAMQKARNVSFRNAISKDVMEVSIGTGSCERTTLTIVIRNDLGHILYSYAAPFKKHVADWYVPNLDREAVAFVDQLLERGIGSTADLPPWEEPEAYEQKHAGHIGVPREVYEDLRARPRPMLSHPTYHEGWKSVVYDEKLGDSVVVVTGGL